MVRTLIVTAVVAAVTFLGTAPTAEAQQNRNRTRRSRTALGDTTSRRKVARRPAGTQSRLELLRRLSSARELAGRRRTYRTQQSVTVAARRAADEEQRRREFIQGIEQQQYLRGQKTAPTSVELNEIVASLESELTAEPPPEYAHELKYSIASCHEALGNPDRAKVLWQKIVTEYSSSEFPGEQLYVRLAQEDLERLESGLTQQLDSSDDSE